MAQRGKLMVPITSFIPDIDQLIVDIFNSRYNKPSIIPATTIYYLCQQIRTILLSSCSHLLLEGPIIVVGDIHGQLYDLLRIFLREGYPGEINYLFLGDYVDRGKYGVEVLCLLYALKIKYPDNIHFIRGNHECAYMNRLFGFQNECLIKYGDLLVWNAFVSTFNVYPFSAVINKKMLCVHGGLSPYLQRIDQLKRISRPTDIPWDGMLCDLVWSDFNSTTSGFVENVKRGISVVFGKKTLETFLEENNLTTLIRGHSFVNGIDIKMPCISIFSASFYQGKFMNSCGVLKIDEKSLIDIHLFNDITHKEITKKLKKDKKEKLKRKSLKLNLPNNTTETVVIKQTSEVQSSATSQSENSALKSNKNRNKKIVVVRNYELSKLDESTDSNDTSSQHNF
ncbi:Ser/Thr protein phosphatase family protein [Entamoeba histolytica HM-1:IMSS-B]|uniref:Serine/threonine-protein phosphatase n=6 Tax=Entamoeba histolytica TaxID=5759 RepID=C4M7Q8_ENTH1|nr:protein phosphatase, putative [Entamoeba histolytica HM-1:IMSS]EMD43509.1 protein phosphatase, putative [Entamoeba histolytica KU27]EMH75930.1 Ser/Thr protein phosphatase family protein [Entamoeba histolytica HM-1:IMSS-B]EMS16668.1 protein phosphatase, putative [Entamoeba histolytica HM-3:IMSS]ENY65349.1 protein phosphatase, putative [Entamoeba histolytica HM-1:IMSS-A]GAT97584.1 Ser Thr protein phosphatase family protein [Entamoeba histolytica]|eukprot:XP_654347.2 protein phosphatase, putative [Entamoeba histolytica HM-1:IMSS]